MCKFGVDDVNLKYDRDSLFVQIWKSKIDVRLDQEKVSFKRSHFQLKNVNVDGRLDGC